MFSENYTRQTALFSAARASEPGLSDGELSELARADEVRIRAIVAERIDTPVTTLMVLARDDAAAVRAAVASNARPDLPEEVRMQLTEDKSPEVLIAALENLAVPCPHVRKLSLHRNKMVSTAARTRASRSDRHGRVKA